VRRTILERAEGIPLYAVETVRMLIDRGLLRLEDGEYHPTGAIGELEVLHAENPSVLAYLRRSADPEDGTHDIVLCVSNLSRFPQPCELMLEQLAGKVPIELTGRVPFPRIGELPYFVTLAPYGFYWFELVEQPVDVTGATH